MAQEEAVAYAHDRMHSVASPIREARQLAMDLPYLQYLDALGDNNSSPPQIRKVAWPVA